MMPVDTDVHIFTLNRHRGDGIHNTNYVEGTYMHYLVLLRCNMDELPVRLFEDKAEAVQFAKTFDADAAIAAWEKLDWSTSDPVFVAVVTFKEGIPTGAEVVRDLDGE